MRRVTVFNQVSLDGYFVDAHGDMRWAHASANDPEWNAFVESNARGDTVLLFGRITYEMMASFWPTPYAAQSNPVVAARMNSLPKIVFSRTLTQASWSNTKLVKTDPAAAVRQLKPEPGPPLVIMGSGAIVSQLTQAHVIDEYQVVVIPIILGQGRTMFEGVEERFPLKLTQTRIFGNGNVWLCYEPWVGQSG